MSLNGRGLGTPRLAPSFYARLHAREVFVTTHPPRRPLSGGGGCPSTRIRLTSPKTALLGNFTARALTNPSPPNGEGTRVIDQIDYEFPLGALGRLVDRVAGRLIFKLMFAPRAQATRRVLEQGQP